MKIENQVNAELIANVSTMIQELADVEKFEESMCAILVVIDYDYAVEAFNDIETRYQIVQTDNGRYHIVDNGGDRVYQNYENAVEMVSDFFSDGYTENLSEYQVSAHEFWAVSDWLAQQLTKQHETVTEFMGFNVWSRWTSGQPIHMDYCIQTIYKNMTEKSN